MRGQEGKGGIPKRPYGRRAWRGRSREGAGAATSLRDALLGLLQSMGGTRERAGLQSLWDNWEKVLGPELAAIAQPLGHHGDGKGAPAGARPALLLGAEDAMLLQELRFRGQEILERVNGFLGQAYFCEVKVSLPLGRSAPVRSRAPSAVPPKEEAGGEPAARGVFLSGMDGNSPVARCYARFARLAKEPGAKVGAEPEDEGKK